MLAAINKWIIQHRLIVPGDRIVVACSGGPDSLALLHILVQLRQRYPIELKVAHVNHMFRPEAVQEAQFVHAMATRWGLDCEQAQIDVPKYMEETGLSGQEAARLVRYRFLQQVAADWGHGKIATGHHRDDQAETVLLHLLRGAGSSGLGGMKAINGAIIRPLLSISRQQIEDYCQQQGLEAVQDNSNLHTDYLRNRVRLELIPLLERHYNPALRESLCRTAEIVGAEQELVAQMANNKWPDVVHECEGRISLNIKQLHQLPLALQRQIFRKVIEKKQGHLRGIQFLHVEKLIEATFSGAVGIVIELPGGLSVAKGYTNMTLLSEAEAKLETGQAIPTMMLAVPGYMDWNGREIRAILTDQLDGAVSPQRAVLDWDELRPPLFIRSRQEGDRFAPYGLKGSKKLKDFFIDNKVPRHLRDSVPLVCDEGGILWVAGYRQSERGKVTIATKRYLQLTFT